MRPPVHVIGIDEVSRRKGAGAGLRLAVDLVAIEFPVLVVFLERQPEGRVEERG